MGTGMWGIGVGMSGMQGMGVRPGNKWNVGDQGGNARNRENVANKDENEGKWGGNVSIGVEMRHTMRGKG